MHRLEETLQINQNLIKSEIYCIINSIVKTFISKFNSAKGNHRYSNIVLIIMSSYYTIFTPVELPWQVRMKLKLSAGKDEAASQMTKWGKNSEKLLANL